MFRRSGSHCRTAHNNLRKMEEQKGNILTPVTEYPRKACDKMLGHYVLDISFEQHYDPILCVSNENQRLQFALGLFMRGRQ